VERYLTARQALARKAMTVYIFQNHGIGSRSIQQSLGRVLADRAQDCAVWNFSTYYGTKSPDYKLTSKESLSIVCPHIFVGAAPIFVKPLGCLRSESEMEKIDGFAGMLREKPNREDLLRLVRIVRRKREKLRAGKDILELSIYDCIADNEKAFELYADEIELCDKFFARYVIFSTDSTGRRASTRLTTQDDNTSDTLLGGQ
jgi:hypothetical protein